MSQQTQMLLPSFKSGVLTKPVFFPLFLPELYHRPTVGS